jgi:hypothetical protein
MRVFLFLAALCLAQSFYSVKYYIGGEGDAQIVNSGSTFAKAPTALEVADLYVRLSGMKSKYDARGNEGILPRLEAKDRKMPLLFDLTGGIVPSAMITEVIRGSAFEDNSRGPHIIDVVRKLDNNLDLKIDAAVYNGEGDNSKDFVEVLKALPAGQPAIILHHETPAQYHHVESRRLANSGNSSYVEPLSMVEIADFNIFIWTTLVLVLAMFYSVMGIANMQVIPDSLLYAKFTSGRNKKSD